MEFMVRFMLIMRMQVSPDMVERTPVEVLIGELRETS
jgi:hypothetical protein